MSGGAKAPPEDDAARAIRAIAGIGVVPAILEVACRATGTRFAAIARVTEDRWVACEVRDEIPFGLKPGGELQIKSTFCNRIRETGEAVIFDDIATDPDYRDDPIPALYGIQSYISVPIRYRDGRFFGTLCALDTRPARLKTPGTTGMFRLFADLIGMHLDTHERLAASEAALLDARQVAELREQFIAVLGHDLRNPLASIKAGTRLLEEEALPPHAGEMVALMQRSAARMAGLIDDVLDLARGRLGGGLIMHLDTAATLAPALEQVIAELRAAWPDREIVAAMRLDQPVRCDGARLAQLLSNLLANALTHGAPDRPVRVGAAPRDGWLEIAVANKGAPIPPEIRARLFQPFFRGASASGHQGLGLGLYIAREIARGHGGALDVCSTPEETRFTFRMPLG